MSFQVALAFEDGVTRFIECEPGQTVADASYRSRINIPLDCRDGACGTCKAKCESGQYDGGSYVEDALSDDEAEQGFCLPCQMKPASDLVLQIASTSAVAKTQAATYEATVAELERLSPTTFALTLEVDGWASLGFLPGQYMNLEVPGTEEVRSYSFSNAPGEDRATFLMKFTPGGAMSTYLDERAAVGDSLRLTGPNGSFFLRESDRPALLLAGGTGLAPVLSILRTLRDNGSTRDVRLVYGASTDADVVRLDEIEQVGSGLAGTFSWDYCVSDPDSTAEHKGYVTSLFDAASLHDGQVDVYLCGPPPMVDAVRGYLKELDVEVHGFFYEKFALATPAPEPVAEPGVTGEDAELEAPVAAQTSAVAPAGQDLLFDSEARSLVGQEIFAARSPQVPVPSAPPVDDRVAVRSLAGQLLFEADRTDAVGTVDLHDGALTADADARGLVGQPIFGARDIEPLVPPVAAPPPADATGAGGYVIGEEHPSVADSDAVFEAREALELGALGLVVGRLSTQQIAGYRLLAEATVPYVEGDRFTDAAGYTESNAAFHDYLFTLTGNQHLLDAYRQLGVQGHMEATLKNATWCHPRCTADHLEIVDALETGDFTAARTLFVQHAEHSKETTRRAMTDQERPERPAWVSPGRFAGMVVLVTGAAQGIGERVARRVGAEGGAVVLADRSDLAGEVARDIAGRGPGGAVAVTADLETMEGAQHVVDEAIARFGRIDVAIHNVGGAIWFKPFSEFTGGQIDAEISRSLMSTLYGCRAVLPPMIAAGGGTIVNVSSIATGGIHRIPYAAAKGGVNAITRALAVEAAGHGVRVVATAPGGTQAPPRRIARGPAPQGERENEWFQAHIDQTLESSLLHRYGTLDEQAAAICFLASPEAGYITGSVLPVGGGDLG